MSKVKISWKQFHHACFHTAYRAKQKLKEIDTIIAIARGGLVPARIIAEYVNPKHFLTIGVSLYNGETRKDKIDVYQDLPINLSWNRNDNILVIDDVSDGGDTFDFVCSKVRNKTKANVFSAAPYIKTDTTFIPDFYVTEFLKDQWIVFPFEED